MHTSTEEAEGKRMPVQRDRATQQELNKGRARIDIENSICRQNGPIRYKLTKAV